MKKSTRLLVVHLSIMSLLHSLGACQVPKMGIFSFHFMCLPSIHHIMLSCFYRIFRISTVECEIVNQFFFSKKKKIPYVYVCTRTHTRVPSLNLTWIWEVLEAPSYVSRFGICFIYLSLPFLLFSISISWSIHILFCLWFLLLTSIHIAICRHPICFHDSHELYIYIYAYNVHFPVCKHPILFPILFELYLST